MDSRELYPSDEQRRRIMDFIMAAGETLLENGAEVFRVEQTMEIMARSFHLREFHVYVLTNGIFASAGTAEIAEVRNVPVRTTHLGRVAAVNALSREIAAGGVTLDEAEHCLAEARRIPFPKGKTQLLAGMSGTACFALIFGGTIRSALAAAAEIGYPVMLKASAGGGGRGIRLVSAPNEMTQAYALAVAEGEASFGDGSVYMEKYVHPARHIEVQVLADEAGNVVCLGERDCSVQRHHQKLIEESPSPAVSRSQRKKLMELTARAVKAIGYVGVGTLEFLLDRDGRFWFMEMNLRLQVEHGVTEMLTQVDLVKWQIRTAAGVPLNFQQQNVTLNGACVECRINALTPGTLSMLHVPGGPFVRFDTYLVSGISVSPYYDALLGKLIVYAGTREEAMRKMKAALCELVVEGIETNIAEQLELVSDPRFMTGQYDLTFMEGR